MSAFRFSIVVVVVAVSVSYFFSGQLQSLLADFLNDAPHQIDKDPIKSVNNNVKQANQKQIFTKEQLWKDYRGTDESKGLYLAFMGKVYDVSEGKKYYEPGGGYDFFAGRDGTKGFVTGDFTDQGLTDDLEGLDSSLYHGFQEWIEFYEKTYKFVGYLVGNFYDASGEPTEALKQVEASIAAAMAEQERSKEDQRKYPMCNSESSAAKGSRVWCSKRSGGIERDWVGVPRLYHYPGTTSMRCACIRTSGPPTDGEDSGANRGDLDNPRLKEYKGCAPDAISCITSKPK